MVMLITKCVISQTLCLELRNQFCRQLCNYGLVENGCYNRCSLPKEIRALSKLALIILHVVNYMVRKVLPKRSLLFFFNKMVQRGFMISGVKYRNHSIIT